MAKQPDSCRSLKVRPDKIAVVKAAFEASSYQTQEELGKDKEVKCSRGPVCNFLNGQKISRKLFDKIYDALETALQDVHSGHVERNDIAMPGNANLETWEGWATNSSTAAVQATSTPIEPLSAEPLESAIDTLVQDVRQKGKNYIQERCGTMKVLDMTWPIGLESIYTDVNILNELTGQRRLNISELSQNVNPENFDRLGYKPPTERMPGLEAVQQQKKLMVFGKPGAGKTTFLKYLAIQCIKRNFLEDCIPFFIPLREFAETQNQPDLLEFMLQELNDVSSDDLLPILQQGRLLLLFDALDEVREKDSHRIIREIEKFARNYPNNHIVVTCRIAAKDYTFEKFTDAEVADFNKQQIYAFATKWFRLKQPKNFTKWFRPKPRTKAKSFINALNKNEPIRELAITPLLLTLLCLIFEAKGRFKDARAALYEEGIDLLLGKWDKSRGIERDPIHPIYRNLPTKHKKELLSQIAFTNFKEGAYLFEQKSLEDFISNYIKTLPEAQTTLETLPISSSRILSSIETAHGLLVQRAKKIYSFSHLTFQEYFTANYIVINSRDPQTIEQASQELAVPLADRR